ncbi:hypothetical protein TCAL_04732 [Tigriopus californicus]|uniref:CUB domain-containing protein n=1 Tax=Tigriopus californicus TaxID=6832 RepID=A0A553PRX7_TIGCA|nr:hypothetical protein TCAL_04732 [Tigriopus californicus]
MISEKTMRSLAMTLAIVWATSFVHAEPEPGRRSKVPSVFDDLEGHNKTTNSREGKVFSLFNIVKFDNDGCRSSSTINGGGSGSINRNGTCFTADECTSKGGAAAGSCAAGFGVCCIFLISNSGGTVTQNCSYIRNPNFPNPYDSTSSVSYTIQNPIGSGCLQYLTGLTGRLTTFNFLPTNDNHLANQDYSICIRQEAGFCCIEYSLCPDVNSFSLDTNGANMKAKIDTSCSVDHIVIEDCTAPFIVDIFTDEDVDAGDQATANPVQSRGLCLEYMQIPC